MTWTHADRRLLSLLLAEKHRRERCQSGIYFPDCTDDCKRNSRDPEEHAGYCRVLYPKHLSFFAAGAQHDERLFMAANQIGKSQSCAYEVAAHATGVYPHWWNGRKFQGTDLSMWCAGNSMEATRDILQVALFGPISGVKEGALVGGMIPHNRVIDYRLKPGAVSYAIHQIWIRQDEKHHGSHLVTDIEFKSYDQGRRLFQGTVKHVIWLDEEPPDPPVSTDSAEDNDIYTECLMRTINADGIVIMSYTPMKGNTPFTDQYLDTASMIDVDGREAPAAQVLFGRATDEVLAEISAENENLRLRAEIEELNRQLEGRR